MKFLFDSVYKLMDKFQEELEGLYGDLLDLSHNRRYDFLEVEAVLMADGYLDFIIERLSGFILRSDIPSDLKERAEELLTVAHNIRDFIYSNFDDVFREGHKYTFAV